MIIHVHKGNKILFHHAEMEQMYKLRYDIFAGERQWKALHREDGRDVDDYDNDDTHYLLEVEYGEVIAGARLYPSTGKTMIKDLFSYLVTLGGIPDEPDIWEVSRLFVRRKDRHSKAVFKIMAALQEFCLLNKIAYTSQVMDTSWLPRLQKVGFKGIPLGLPSWEDDGIIIAVLIKASEEALVSVRKFIDNT